MMADPSVLLPANLARLADLCDPYAARYALSGVHVLAEEGSFVVCASDTRRLALVRGRVDHNPLDYPTVPELIAEGEGSSSAVVPAREWKEAFKSLPKGSAVNDQPILAHVAIHLGGEESILATTDGEEANVIRTRNVEGRFPDYEAVIPRDEIVGRAIVDGRHLLGLLRVAVETAKDEEGISRITLEFRNPSRPLVLRAGNATQEFIGLIMPAADPERKNSPG